MGKRGKRVICAVLPQSILVDMLIVSRVDKDEAASDEAVIEQTILGVREQTKPTSFEKIRDMRRTTMSSKSWARTKNRNFGKQCGVTYQTASDSRALKRNMFFCCDL